MHRTLRYETFFDKNPVRPERCNLKSNEYHGHRCPACGFFWEHDPNKEQTPVEYVAAHDCPNCREKNVTLVYQGPWASDTLSEFEKLL